MKNNRIWRDIIGHMRSIVELSMSIKDPSYSLAIIDRITISKDVKMACAKARALRMPVEIEKQVRNIEGSSETLFNEWLSCPEKSPSLISAPFPFIEQACSIEERRLNWVCSCPCIEAYLSSEARYKDVSGYYKAYDAWSKMRAVTCVEESILVAMCKRKDEALRKFNEKIVPFLINTHSDTGSIS